MDILKVIILGITEGLTEFLPISSTGHLILVNKFINFTGEFASIFDIVIQLGAILSVIVYFRKRLYPGTLDEETLSLWKKAIIGTVPALFIGFLADDIIEKILFKPSVVIAALIIGGVILIIVELNMKESKINSIKDMTYKTAICIGFCQCLAMIPGTSRSAATIIGGMLLGLSRGTAAEFSFYLAIPIMAAASTYKLLKSGLSMTGEEWFLLAVGFVVSFMVALGVIAFFMNYIRKRDFKIFAYYRIILGIVLIFLIRYKIL